MTSVDPKAAARAAQQWVTRLAACPLPILPDTLEAVRELLSRSRSSMPQLAARMGRDPAAVLHVLREANRFAVNREIPIRDLAHALSLLGMERIRALTDRLPVCAPDTDRAYRQLLMTSLHAGSLTARLCALNQREQSEESGWTAMIWLAPAWALAQTSPEHLQRLRTEPVEAVLGCRWNAIARGLFQQWQLLRLVEDIIAVRDQMGPRQWVALARSNRTRRGAPISWDETLRGLVYREGCYVELGNRLALSAARGWYQRPTMRWLRAIGNILGKPLSLTTALVHSQAAEAGRNTCPFGVAAPAAGLLLPPQPDSMQVTDQDPVEHAAPARLADTACLREQATLLGSNRLATIPQVLQVLLKALHLGMGLERVAIAGYSVKSRQLRVQASAGIGATAPLRSYQEQLQAGDLLSRLLNGDKGLWLRADNHARLAPLQPQGFSRCREGDEFMAAPLRNGTQSLALVYVDAGTAGTGFSEAEYKRFCQLCARAGQAIIRIQSATQG